jgi:serine/threonine protein kinase
MSGFVDTPRKPLLAALSSIPVDIKPATRTYEDTRPLTLPDGNKPVMLGKGSYGCVLSPPIPCMTGTERPRGFAATSSTSHVSKVFMDMESGVTGNEIRIELKKRNFLKVMDPRSLFTVPFDGFCKADLSAETIKEACNAPKGMRVNQLQILYRNGGPDLAKIMRSGSMTFMQLLPCFVSVMCGLVKMNTKPHSFMHMDIKPANITLGADGHCKLIDFGFLTLIEELYDSPGLFERRSYEFWPLEYDILKDSPDSNRAKLEGSIFDRLSDDLKYKVHDRFFGEFSEFLRNLSSLLPDSPDDWYLFLVQHYSDKFDVYSLGVTMLILYNRMNRKGAGPEVLEFILKLMHGNPAKRPTADEALSDYLSLFRKGELGDISVYLELANRHPAESYYPKSPLYESHYPSRLPGKGTSALHSSTPTYRMGGALRKRRRSASKRSSGSRTKQPRSRSKSKSATKRKQRRSSRK